MPSALTEENRHVADLLFHVGVGLEMDYSPEGSGAYSNRVPQVLTSFFRYMGTANYLERESNSRNWLELLQGELDLDRPIYYSGSRDGAHAFVVDGYEGTSHFHINWGWGGHCDGYFYLDDLNPCDYDDSDYTDNQDAVLFILPYVPATPIPTPTPSPVITPNESPTPGQLPPDLNGDHFVDSLDLLHLIQHWHSEVE